MGDDLELEARIERACRAGDHANAATLAVEHYGGEILAFLIARMRSTSDGEEVFAAFAEKLWVGLPSFEWRCSLRSWAYRLARNAGNDYAGAAHNRPGRHVPVSQVATLSAAVERVRTTTALYRRTDAKDRVRALREALSPDDQMLLVLRVDRGMDFRELAAAMVDGVDGSEMLDDDALDKSAARLRKRFERVKERLRELARADGLL